ncbi:MAG: S41 family peptidase [Anaerolineae bacterium]
MKRAIIVFGILLGILILLVLGLAGGIVLDRQLLTSTGGQGLVSLLADTPPAGIPNDAVPQFKLMAEAWNLIEARYVDRPAVQPKQMAYGSISGMVDSLGDTGHSRFLSPEMVQAEQSFNQGQIEGIGVYVQMKDGHLVIVSPIDGSPAQKAGLKAGEIILGVGGTNVADLPLDQVIGMIMGPAGTSVTLTILNPDSGQTRDVTVTRAKIEVQNVIWHQLPGTQVAHLRIVAFSKGVTDDLKQALSEIQQQGLEGIILDLRSNPGGLLDESVGTASQFLAGGNVLLVKDAQGNTTPVPVEDGGTATDIPLVVLINQGTASAAEIVSGALQDAGRAKLVGQTTFGTGTVLNQFDLSDGSAILLATEEWLTPKGRVIWHKGITPDVVVALPADATPLLPMAEEGLTAEQLQASDDAQLLKALDLLTGSTQAPADPARSAAGSRE